MRKFVFNDKSKVEMNIITGVLADENIPYKILKFVVKDYFFGEEDDEDFCIIEEMYNIECFTDLEHYDFVKHIAYKKIKDRMKLEKCYIKEASKKRVRRVSKKSVANTNRKHRGKSKE